MLKGLIWRILIRVLYLSGMEFISLKGYFPRLPKRERESMEKVLYVSAIGSLTYAMLCIRLDIAYSISVTSRD